MVIIVHNFIKTKKMKKLIITCLIVFLSLLPECIFAPNLSNLLVAKREENIKELIKFNEILDENQEYYPFINVSDTFICDIDFLKEKIHRIFIIKAIGMVEIGHDFRQYSKFNKNQRIKYAFNVGEGAVGITQMRKVMWTHITKELKLGKYHIHDRWNASKSYEMFILFQDHYNPDWDIERVSRDWNGGGNLGMRKKMTYSYYQKVKYHYNKFKKQYSI